MKMMKKLFGVLFLAVFGSLSFAFYFPTPEEQDCLDGGIFYITFKDSSIWFSKYSFGYGRSDYLSDSLGDVLEDGYNCNKYGLNYEKSFLDEHVFLDRLKIKYPYQFDMYSTKKATHGMGDVLRDEFIHWHQCDMLAISLEEMETMIAPIVEMLNSGYASDYKEGLYDTTKVKIYDFYTGPYPKKISQWRFESCGIDTTAQIVAKSNNNCADQILFENGSAVIPQEFVGKP